MAEVIYTRKETDTEVNNVAITDGQIIYTKQGHVFMDYDNNRIPMQNTPDNTMSDVSTNSVSNNVIKSYVDTKTNEINTKINKKKIWENNSYSTDFPAQTITLTESLVSYEGYEILFRQSTTAQRIMTTGIIPVGYGTILDLALSTSFFRPTGTTVSGDTITFEDCHVSDGTTQNNILIPLMVIAHKKTVFNEV